MRRNPLLVAVALGALLVAATSAAGGGLFGYDATLPLNATFGTPTTSDGIVRQPFAYDATESLRLDGIFVHPSSGGPWPLVIWSPGAGGDRTQQMPDATAAAKSGLASLLVDTPPFSNCRDGRADLESVVAYVVSRRRAIDLAQTLPNVDAKRLSAAGFSLGAEVTASLAGVDHRIAAFALKSGRGHLSGFARIVCASLGPKLGDYMADARTRGSRAVGGVCGPRVVSPPERNAGRPDSAPGRPRALPGSARREGAPLVPGLAQLDRSSLRRPTAVVARPPGPPERKELTCSVSPSQSPSSWARSRSASPSQGARARRRYRSTTARSTAPSTT